MHNTSTHSKNYSQDKKKKGKKEKKKEIEHFCLFFFEFDFFICCDTSCIDSQR